jgi:PAS domain S-box-containing protein
VVDSTSFIYEEVNSSFNNILGYDPYEIQGKPVSDFIYEQDLQHTIEIANQAATQNLEVFEFENRMRCKDGSLRWFNWNAIAKSGRWYAGGRDITERKKLKTILHDTQAMAKWEAGS